MRFLAAAWVALGLLAGCESLPLSREELAALDKDIRGAYGGFYPMVVYIRDGKVVAANGDGLERAAGVRYAHAQCRELGYEVPS